MPATRERERDSQRTHANTFVLARESPSSVAGVPSTPHPPPSQSLSPSPSSSLVLSFCRAKKRYSFGSAPVRSRKHRPRQQQKNSAHMQKCVRACVFFCASVCKSSRRVFIVFARVCACLCLSAEWRFLCGAFVCKQHKAQQTESAPSHTSAVKRRPQRSIEKQKKKKHLCLFARNTVYSNSNAH